MTCWCYIPARGGSRGLPDKNLAEVGGLSLVAHAVIAARRFAIDIAPESVRVVVDTDSTAIADEARAFGAEVPFLRDVTLAQDETPTMASLVGFFSRWGTAQREDLIVLLQPTSPLRTAGDIGAVWRAMRQAGAASAATVAPTSSSVDLALLQHPDGSVRWLADDAPDGRRRQDCRATVHLTGAIYATYWHTLQEHRTFIRPSETLGVTIDSARAADIDDAHDLAAADALRRASRPDALRFGSHQLAGGAPCFIIAEAGVNHDGDVATAHALIDAAADAGADAVKFQTFDPAALVSADAPSAQYQKDRTGADVQQAMLEALTLPSGAWAELAAHAAARGILFLSTPFDRTSADLLESLGLTAFKVPSGELTNLPFIRDLARRGKPLFISTGMATMAEVADALLAVHAAGAPPVALLHCVSAYPAPPHECNLAAIATLRSAFQVPAGWSDHTPGTTACVAAAALGAVVLEKHLTLDCTRSGPDHAASLEPAPFAQLVREVRMVEAALGDGRKRPMPSEHDVRRVARRSLHLARDVHAGEELQAQDIIALRPGTGLSPSVEASVIGRRLTTTLTRGTLLETVHLG